MKKNKIFFTAAVLICVSLFFAACKKDNKTLPATETYKLVGRIDPTRTTLTTAALTQAEFNVSYNSANSFGEAQSVVTGSLSLTGYTGITGKDTLSFFATQATGPAISYLSVPSAAVNTTTATNYYSYFDGAAATFSLNNFPFRNEVTAALKDGRGYFRLGQSPKYVFILLDNVTKL